jgi:DNA-directed RNA polymerase specialized sigma24 family protein
MIASPALTERAIDRAFLTALLLTGSAERAEDAVIEALDLWDEEEEHDELMYAAARAAVASRSESKKLAGEELESAMLLVPAELRGVLRLSSELRQCFVLRILLGLSTRACARALELHVRQVDRCTAAALEKVSSLHQSIGRTARAASGFLLRVVQEA